MKFCLFVSSQKNSQGQGSPHNISGVRFVIISGRGFAERSPDEKGPRSSSSLSESPIQVVFLCMVFVKSKRH